MDTADRRTWLIAIGAVAILIGAGINSSRSHNDQAAPEPTTATTATPRPAPTRTQSHTQQWMPQDGTYQIGGFNPEAIYYGTYQTQGSADGTTPCIWFRRDDTYIDGRFATGITQRHQVPPGTPTQVTLSHQAGDRYFTTINCQPWTLTEMG